ncbi:MAG: sugar phosphate nucleotidyltransferase [Ignavibacteria bacterium]
MKVIIPVAGVGTRLRPHTITQPKVLLNVAGHPMIYYIVDELIRKKIANSIIFITGHQGEKIEHYLNSTFNFRFDYVKQRETLGLGHAVLCAKGKFDPIKKEDVLIILGDTLFDVNLKDMVKSRYSVIGVKKVDDPRRFGVVEKDKKGFIKRLIEKPASKDVSPSSDAIVGIYLLKNSTLLFDSIEHIIRNKITTKGEYQLTDALEIMLRQNEKMVTYNVHGWLDCGKPETLLQTNRYLLGKKSNDYRIKGSKINKPVYIGKNVTLENCIIGPNATINDGCLIRNSIVDNSIIDNNCHIENAVVTDSLVGRNSKIIKKRLNLNLGEFSEI